MIELDTAWAVVMVFISLVLFLVSTATLWSQMHAWRTPETYEGIRFPPPAAPWLSFSLIMPCREESEAVMTATLDALLAQDHPDFEVIISVGHDDVDTTAIAQWLAQRSPGRVKVSINTDLVKNKPRQLNTALGMCTKQIVGIIDAESLTHPRLLSGIDTTFVVHDVDIVQGAVHLMNYRTAWFTLRNCLEYRTWFRSRLHGHAKAGFIPLGGNTVFIKRDALDEVGGWDGNCLAEDCEIGVRLSVLGKTTAVVYDKELITREEAPGTIGQLIKQRTRWALGFMQVLAKNDWRGMPTRRGRFVAWWTLVQQHAMAFAGVAIPLAVITALFVDMPPAVVLVAFLPAIPTVLTLAFEVLILHEFGRDMGFRIRTREYVVLILSTPFYQLMLAMSSLRAAWKFFTGDFSWEKTSHHGLHLPGTLTSPAPVAAASRDIAA